MPPPSLPPQPPPLPPAVEMTPDRILKSESTNVTLSRVEAGSYAVFLVAGDTSCDGAVAGLSLSASGDKAGGRLDGASAIVVLLKSPLVHKLCTAPPSDDVPSSDTAFTLADRSYLEVVDWSPRPPPSPPTPPPPAPPPASPPPPPPRPPPAASAPSAPKAVPRSADPELQKRLEARFERARAKQKKAAAAK